MRHPRFPYNQVKSGYCSLYWELRTAQSSRIYSSLVHCQQDPCYLQPHLVNHHKLRDANRSPFDYHPVIAFPDDANSTAETGQNWASVWRRVDVSSQSSGCYLGSWRIDPKYLPFLAQSFLFPSVEGNWTLLFMHQPYVNISSEHLHGRRASIIQMNAAQFVLCWALRLLLRPCTNFLGRCWLFLLCRTI